MRQLQTAKNAILTALCLLSGVVLWSCQSDAKDGSWKKRCEPESSYCEIYQRADAKVEDKTQRIAEFAIGYPKGGDTARGVVILPLGMLVQTPVAIVIDDKKDQAFSFKVNHCMPNGCFGYINVNETVADVFKAGTDVALIFQAQNGQSLSVKLPLTGFSKAYGDITKAHAQQKQQVAE